jgi:hypothetical protein
MNNDKLWITTPHENIKYHYDNTHKLLKDDNPSIKEAEILTSMSLNLTAFAVDFVIILL